MLSLNLIAFSLISLISVNAQSYYLRSIDSKHPLTASLVDVGGSGGHNVQAGLVPITSFSWGANLIPLVPAVGASVNRINMLSFTVVKPVDVNSPYLYLLLAQQPGIQELELSGWGRNTPSTGTTLPFFSFRARNVNIASININAVTGSAPTETITFVYTELMELFTPLKPDSTSGVSVGYAWSNSSNGQLVNQPWMT